MQGSERASRLSSSPTLALTAKANQMKKEGKPVISFGAGEPDFDTPEIIKEAGHKAISDGFTKYTPSSGITELKEAICMKFWSENNLFYEPKNIIVTCGAKQALYNTLLALCNPGDEVIIPSPYWVSFAEMVRLCDAVPVFVETTAKENFMLNPSALKEKITKKTKAMILNSPCNPTGAVMEKPVLERIAELALEYGFYVISDEIYEKILYDGETHVSIASLGKEIQNKTIVVNGVSKTYSMTGWRIGYAAADEAILSLMSRIQDHTTSNAASIAQKAALAAITIKQAQEEVKKMVHEFSLRRDLFYKKLCGIPDITCFKPRGAFYIFPDVHAFFNKTCKGKTINSSQDFCDYLLDEALLAVVPGHAFGNDHHLRFSFAASQQIIEEGLKRFEDAVKKLA